MGRHHYVGDVCQSILDVCSIHLTTMLQQSTTTAAIAFGVASSALLNPSMAKDPHDDVIYASSSKVIQMIQEGSENITCWHFRVSDVLQILKRAKHRVRKRDASMYQSHRRHEDNEYYTVSQLVDFVRLAYIPRCTCRRVWRRHLGKNCTTTSRTKTTLQLDQDL
jgi:hypothetical protein